MATTSPFFQGTLHEAIAHSMQSSLHFAALIVDNASDAVLDSSVWEKEYLGDEELAKVLKERTILYRIAGEGPEAMDLYAFFPRPKRLPCLVIIKSGTAQVESIGVADGQKTLEMVREWVRRVVGLREGSVVGNTAIPAPATSPALVAQDSAREIEPPAQPPQPTVTPSNISEQPPLLSNVYDPRVLDTTTLPTVQGKGKGRATSDESPSSKTLQDRELARREAHQAQQASKDSNSGCIAEKQKRAQEVGVGGENVRGLLEVGKAMGAVWEREARERERGEDGQDSLGRVQGMGRKAGKECALSFRLLDGSALKHKFPAEVKLGVEVRKWIDQNRPDETDRPYTFTQLLNPFPNKHISLSEENISLKDLGLTPSATLVLAPSNTTQTSAYPPLGTIPFPWRLVDALTTGVSSVVSLGYNAITSTVSAVTGGQPTQSAAALTPNITDAGPQPIQSGHNSPRPSRGNGVTRIRTIHDGGGGFVEGKNIGNKFYNGNQLNFEPNQDDRDGK